MDGTSYVSQTESNGELELLLTTNPTSIKVWFLKNAINLEALVPFPEINMANLIFCTDKINNYKEPKSQLNLSLTMKQYSDE
jgi:hypothetical protein